MGRQRRNHIVAGDTKDELSMITMNDFDNVESGQMRDAAAK